MGRYPGENTICGAMGHSNAAGAGGRITRKSMLLIINAHGTDRKNVIMAANYYSSSELDLGTRCSTCGREQSR